MTRQRVRIRLNGQPVGELSVDAPAPREYQLALPAGGLQAKNVLTFDLPDATSPAALNDGQDLRLLGIALQWIELDEAEPTPPPTPAPTP